METKQTVSFNRIFGLDLDKESIAHFFESKRYSENAGIGFTYIHIEDDVIVTKVLIRTPSYIQNYNIQENVFEKKIVNIYEEIELLWDFQYGLIYSTSSFVKFSKAKIFLRNCFGPGAILKSVDCSPEKVFEGVISLGWNPFITDLSINNFVYKEGISGRFTIHLDNSKVGNELLSQYYNNISKLTMNIESNIFSSFTISVSRQSSLTIRCQETDFWSIVNSIKKNL